MGCLDSSSQESTQTSKRLSQDKLLDKLIGLFTPEADKGPSVFPGERVAPLTALQTGAIEGAQDVGAAFTTPQTSPGFGGGPLAGQTTDAVSDLLAGNLGATPLTAQKFGELFQSSISDPARKTFREETRPAIDEAFAGPGFVSSARSKEIVKQKTDLEDALQSSLSAGQLQNIRQNQALAEAKAARTQGAVRQAIDVGEAQTQTIRDNIAIAASQIQGIGDLIGIGSVEQTQEQKEIFALMTRFAEENQIIDADDLAIMLSLLNLNFGAASGSTSGPGLGFSVVSGLASSGSFAPGPKTP